MTTRDLTRNPITRRERDGTPRQRFINLMRREAQQARADWHDPIFRAVVYGVGLIAYVDALFAAGKV